MKFLKFFILCIFASCSHDPILIDPDSMGTYYLLGVISPHVSPCGVVVGYSLPESIPDDLSGVSVICSGNGRSVTFAEQRPGVYWEEPTQLEVAPGKRYDITARINREKTLRGFTFVPGDFQILKSGLPDTFVYILRGYNQDWYPLFSISEYGPPEIQWSASEHAFVYSLSINRFSGISSFDTTSFLPAIRDEKNVQDQGITEWTEKYQIKITAYDSTYLPWPVFDYEDFNSQNNLIDKYIEERGYHTGYNDNIKGGAGYFSSRYTITDSIIIHVKKEILNWEEP
ncbi:hypothetical protein JXQ31_11215 [candidate division KSB1 bacterium]|nr:hypothetical protein [candidate division KSB1 bacterium]